jgi:hypothetical protein
MIVLAEQLRAVVPLLKILLNGLARADLLLAGCIGPVPTRTCFGSPRTCK